MKFDFFLRLVWFNEFDYFFIYSNLDDLSFIFSFEEGLIDFKFREFF